MALAAIMPRISIRMPSLGSAGRLVFAGRVIQNVNGLLVTTLLVREFGLAASGTLTISSVGVVILGIVLTFGLPFSLAAEPVSIRRKNSIGLVAALVMIPIAAPAAVLYGWALGRDPNEAWAIALLTLGGPFVAQLAIVNALLAIQGRAALCLVAPLISTLGIGAAVLGRDLVEVSLIVSATRLLGIAVVFMCLSYASLPMGSIVARLRRGSAFLPMDVMALCSDQAAILMLGLLLSRADLGILGMCRQLMSAADTPAWSFVQTKYPELVETKRRTVPALRRRLLFLGTMFGGGAFAASVVLGDTVFHVPTLWYSMLALAAATPARYLLHLYDNVIRSAGAITACNRLAFVKLSLWIVLLPLAAFEWHLGGAIAIQAGLPCLAALLTWLAARQFSPPGRVSS